MRLIYRARARGRKSRTLMRKNWRKLCLTRKKIASGITAELVHLQKLVDGRNRVHPLLRFEFLTRNGKYPGDDSRGRGLVHAEWSVRGERVPQRRDSRAGANSLRPWKEIQARKKGISLRGQRCRFVMTDRAKKNLSSHGRAHRRGKLILA